MVAYSRGFCTLLGVDIIHTIADIKSVLSTSDAQALDSHYIDLKESETPFSIIVKLSKMSKILRLSGQYGMDVTANQRYHIIWLEDVTDQVKSKEALESQLKMLNKDHDRDRALLNALPLPLWIYNARHELTWCNEAYAEMLATSKEESLSKQKHIGLNLGKEKGKVSARKLAQQASESKQTHSEEGRIIVDGTRKTIKLSHMPLDQHTIVAGYAEDLTQVDQLKSDIERYQSANTKLLENFSSAIVIFNADEKLEFYNSAFTELWGLEDNWLNNRPKLGDVMEKLREMRKLPEQADFKSFKHSWVRLFTSLLHMEEDMLHLPDGRALRIVFAPHPMGGLMITFDDVTSRLELESSYNTLIAVQRETLDNLAEGVAVFGSDGKLTLWNPSFLKLWDFKEENLNKSPHISSVVEDMKSFFDPSKYQNVSDPVAPEDPKPLKNQNIEWAEIQPVLSAYGLERTDSKELIQRADGIYIEVSQVALPDGGVMMTYRNVTDTMRVERALREKATALEEAEKLKMDFLANVSYQLRTPLNAIMGFSEILSHEYFGELNDRQKEYSQGIAEAGSKLMSLIDNILDLSTIEAGYLSLTREPLDVYRLINDVYNLTHDWAGKETLHVKSDVPDDIGLILADERRMKQVLVNLVRNAISFTPGGGDIILSATRHGPSKEQNFPHIVISVADTGIGIPEDDIEKVFEPFERSSYDENGMKNQTGPGLGLSLVKSIVDLHGGDIVVTSRMGEGTTISITMPVYSEDDN